MDHDLDMTDYRILHVVQDCRYWKNRIHSELEEQTAEDASVQTVGRRVDQLQDADLLDSAIVSPDDLKRDLIIAFSTTDKADNILAETKICPDCNKVVGPDEKPHHHEYTAITDYIAAEADDESAAETDTETDTDADADAAAA